MDNVKWLGPILSLVLSCSVGFANPLDALSSDELSVAPRDGHNLFLNSIDQAKTSIDMVMFHLSDPEAVTHLIDSSAKGVKIRIILDQKILTGATASKIVDQLRKAGVQVKGSSNKFTISHEKAAVFDNTWALITSINLTKTVSNTRDFGVKTADANIVSEFENVFATDWINADNNTQDTPQLTDEKLVWSPVNSKPKLLDLINGAKISITLEVENLGDHEIIAALAGKAKQGLKVLVVVPACVEGSGTRNFPYLKDLAQAGVDARTSMPPYTFENPYIHAKGMVIDADEFYIGSENLSYNSLTAAREVGIIEKSLSISTSIYNVIIEDANRAQPIVNVPADFVCTSQ